MSIRVNETHRLRVLPLHLVCAFDPPTMLVETLLRHYVDASALPICVGGKTKKRKLLRRVRSWKKGVHRRVLRSVKNEERHIENPMDDEKLLGNNEDKDPAYYTTQEGSQVKNFTFVDEDTNGVESKMTSVQEEEGVLFRIAKPDVEEPEHPIKSKSTDSTSGDSDEKTFYNVDWDLSPLFDFVVTYGELLPLHVACLYRASTPSVEQLVAAFPNALLTPVIGMLPIHLVSAGWSVRNHSLVKSQSAAPVTLSLLECLAKAAPGALRIKSGNHGMTAWNYIDEYMEGEHRGKALTMLVHDDATELTSDPFLFIDSEDQSTIAGSELSKKMITCVSALISEGNWEQVLALVEDDPSLAKEWMYGVDRGRLEAPIIWKRLPIHLACAHGAPLGLIEVLLDAYPSGSSVPDPSDGSIALHIACRHSPSISLVEELLDSYPEGMEMADKRGRLPLHVACLGLASEEVIQVLASRNPNSVNCKDADGKTPLDLAKGTGSKGGLIMELLETMHLFCGTTQEDLNQVYE